MVRKDDTHLLGHEENYYHSYAKGVEDLANFQNHFLSKNFKYF